MSKVPVHLLPKSVQTLVEQLVAAGFSLVNATTGNGRRNLGDDGPLRADELQRALQTQLADECHDQSALDISAVRLTRRQSFEDVTITFDTAGLKAAGEADSTPVACVLPSHMPATCRKGAEAVLALGYRPHGHLTFIKGNFRTQMPDGIRVQFSWIP
jgi:hypothetical protein